MAPAPQCCGGRVTNRVGSLRAVSAGLLTRSKLATGLTRRSVSCDSHLECPVGMVLWLDLRCDELGPRKLPGRPQQPQVLSAPACLEIDVHLVEAREHELSCGLRRTLKIEGFDLIGLEPPWPRGPPREQIQIYVPPDFPRF